MALYSAAGEVISGAVVCCWRGYKLRCSLVPERLVALSTGDGEVSGAVVW